MRTFQKTLLHDLLSKDIIAGALKLFASGYYIDPRTDKITTKLQRRIDHSWIHIKPESDEVKCTLHRLIFSCYNFVPTYCLDCWKVVVKPRTVEQLFDLYDLMTELDYPSKCGIEDKREWVSGLYGGYFYNRGKAQALSRKAEVKPLVEKRVGHDVSVYVKRFCTEFEIRLCPGKSGTYQQPQGIKQIEELAYANFDDFMVENGLQPEFQKTHIKAEWLKFASKHGDKTAEKANNNDSFYPLAETYNG